MSQSSQKGIFLKDWGCSSEVEGLPKRDKEHFQLDSQDSPGLVQPTPQTDTGLTKILPLKNHLLKTYILERSLKYKKKR